MVSNCPDDYKYFKPIPIDDPVFVSRSVHESAKEYCNKHSASESDGEVDALFYIAGWEAKAAIDAERIAWLEEENANLKSWAKRTDEMWKTEQERGSKFLTALHKIRAMIYMKTFPGGTKVYGWTDDKLGTNDVYDTVSRALDG